MINLEEICIRNFLSYGDFDTVIPLSSLGQCVITGAAVDQNTGELDYRRNNGSGKSNLPQAIIWLLTGRTMHADKPRVRNIYTNGDCVVTGKLRDGSVIQRIQTTRGTTELLFSRDGVSLINTTLSTTGNQQATLERELGFDYDTLCGSSFDSQFNTPWLERSDQARKKLIERIIGMDRINCWAEAAKNRITLITSEISKLNVQIEYQNKSLQESKTQLEDAENKKREWLEKQEVSKQNDLNNADKFENQAALITIPDINELKSKHNLIEKINEKINSIKLKREAIVKKISEIEKRSSNQLFELTNLKNSEHTAKDKALELTINCFDEEIENYTALRDESLKEANKSFASKIKANEELKSKTNTHITITSANIKSLLGKINSWKEKDGKQCFECEQEIPHSHTEIKIAPYELEVSNLEKELAATKEQLTTIERDSQTIKDDHDSITTAITNDYDTKTESVKQNKKEAKENTRKAKLQIDLEFETAKSELLANSRKEVESLNSESSKLSDYIDTIQKQVKEKSPEMSVSEAEAKESQKQQLTQNAISLRAKYQTQIIETPYDNLISTTSAKITATEEEIKASDVKLTNAKTTEIHLTYINRAYSERKKIKSRLISRQIPKFNSKLHHYLDTFQLKVKVSLTDTLSLDTNKYSYNYQSGGERARSDKAFMFAIFDLHKSLHGQQSNFLVLDEPDSRLDSAGIECLAEIIKGDLAKRFDTILIISQRQEMHNLFPRQILVVKTNDISRIAEIR